MWEINVNRTLATAKSIFDSARQRQHALTRDEYQALSIHNKTIATYASADQKIEYYSIIVEQIKDTEDGTAQHGRYLALQDHFYRACHQNNFDVSDAFKQKAQGYTSPKASPAAIIPSIVTAHPLKLHHARCAHTKKGAFAPFFVTTLTFSQL